MISYKVVLIVAALALGCGVGSTVAINYFFPEEDKTATRHAIYCEHFKYDKNPFPGCEAFHVGH